MYSTKILTGMLVCNDKKVGIVLLIKEKNVQACDAT